MSRIDVRPARIEKLFRVLEGIGNLGQKREDGFLRASWSDEESRAMDLVRRTAEEEGMTSFHDAVGNLFVATPGDGSEIVYTGSHLDTVPMGGNYDGAAGVVCGLEAVLALKPDWPKLKKRLGVVAWRGEESACYTAVCKGSQAAFGLSDPAILGRKFRGKTLEEAIRGQGFDPGPIANRVPSLGAEGIRSIAALVELHIEQAKLLETRKKPIGVITSIRGTVRMRIEVTGEANHSGGTPMGTDYRKDANLAIAHMQVAMDERSREAIAAGKDLVQTVGLVNSDADFNKTRPELGENAITKVSPYGYFALDIRSDDEKFLFAYADAIEALIGETAVRFKVEARIQRLMSLKPVERLDAEVRGIEEAVCRELGIDYLAMPSGALHDAAVVANRTRSDGKPIPVGMLFIPCRDGISHNPAEYASPEDLARGAAVLAGTMKRLAE